MRTIFSAIVFWLLTALSGQPESPATASSYTSGEWFQFRIHYGFLNASFATLSLTEETYKGKEVYHVKGYGRTTGFASIFFKVEDIYESVFDKYDGKPYKFIRNINEGGYTKNLEIHFDHGENEAVVYNKKHNKQMSVKTPEGVQDLLSGFYFLRENYDSGKLVKGESITLDLLYDDEPPFRFRLKFLGRETVSTKFGKVKALKFRPYVQSGRVFKEEEGVTLWVSDDANKIPLRIQADLVVGSLKADLHAFRGLKNQFKIEMN